MSLRLTYAGNFEWPSSQARAIQTVHTAHALARAGVDVELVTMQPSVQTVAPDQALALYGLEPHPNFRSQSVPVIRAPDSLSMIEIHKRLAVNNVSYCLTAALRTMWHHGREPNHWIFTRDPRVAWTFIRLRPLTRARVVYEVHELFGTRPRDNNTLDPSKQWGVAHRTRHLENAVLQQADRLITLTQACKRLILETYPVSETNVTVVPDGTRVLRRRPRKEPGRSIIYLGQLYRWKGVDTLVHAMRDVPNATLAIVGTGEIREGRDVDRRRLEELVKSLGLEQRVSFESFVPYDQVPERLGLADVATVPLPDVLMSRYFTSPLKLFDAMAAEVPIVASSLDSIQEILRDNENAVLVPPDDPAALAAGLRRVLDHPEYARGLANAARNHAQTYSWEARASRIIDVLSHGR
jgi:glycosyltransferase involved in cell wall biosynthesis